jgi:hypothetical protein
MDIQLIADWERCGGLPDGGLAGRDWHWPPKLAGADKRMHSRARRRSSSA